MDSVPLVYNANKAKFECNLRWLLGKAGVNWNDIVKEKCVKMKSQSLLERLMNVIPFFEWNSCAQTSAICKDTPKSQFLLTPDMIKGLASAEIYYKAMVSLFPDDKECFYESHWSINQWISKQKVDDYEIDETLLERREHFDHDVHVKVIDKIMQAFVNRTLTMENVLTSVRKFSMISVAEKLPKSTEDIIVFWSNKVFKHMYEKFKMRDDIRYNKLTQLYYDDLFSAGERRHLSNGRSLALLLSFYRPDVMKFEDINFDKNCESENKLSNLEKCADACSRLFFFPPKNSNSNDKRILHMTLADVYYNCPEFHVCLMVVFAELFKVFELSERTGGNHVGSQTSAPECCHSCGEQMNKDPSKTNKCLDSRPQSPRCKQETISSEGDDNGERRNDRGDEEKSRKPSNKIPPKPKWMKNIEAKCVRKDWHMGDGAPKSPGSTTKVCIKSNKIIIENALTYCSLSGEFDANMKSEVLEVLKNSTGKHFVILFRDSNKQYRGLYVGASEGFDNDTIVKVQGVGPKFLNSKHIEKFYKYNSGTKNFVEVTSTKHLSVVVDAVVMLNSLWKKINPRRNLNDNHKARGKKF